MRTDRTIHVLLAAIAFLLGANLLVNVPHERTASAAAGGGVFDPAGQQSQTIVIQLTELNRKMDRLQTFMESSKLGVVVKEMPKADK